MVKADLNFIAHLSSGFAFSLSSKNPTKVMLAFLAPEAVLIILIPLKSLTSFPASLLLQPNHPLYLRVFIRS